MTLPPVTQGVGRLLLLAFGLGVGTAIGVWLVVRAVTGGSEAPAPAVTRELAAEKIEDHHAEGQATRKAAKARVAQEIQDAVRDGDLVSFLERHAPH